MSVSLPHSPGRGEVVLQDRLNHASLIDGTRQSGARLLRYAHVDATAAQQLAAAHAESFALLATDGVFSMDGDSAPLRELAATARAHDAWLLVDDAHGFGILGPKGTGSIEAAGLTRDDVPLMVGTLGKACGTFGAFVAGDLEVIDLILQRARSYIYTTALPSAVAAATRASLTIVRAEAWRRERLAQLITRFRAGAARLQLPLATSITPIQPVLLPGAAQCLAASQLLMERGFWVSAIRHPTVPAGTERLRVTLSAGHREEGRGCAARCTRGGVAPTAERSMSIATGNALHVERRGATRSAAEASPGLPVVMLHGWGMNLRVFDLLRADLAEYETWAIDLPGHGRSPWWSEAVRFEVQQQAVLEVLPPRCVLLGWSFGAKFALAIAAEQPQRVAALVLLAASPRFARSEDWPRGMEKQALRAFDAVLAQDWQRTLQDFIALQLRGSRGAEQAQQVIEAALAAQGAPRREALLAGMALLDSVDLRALVPRVAQPTLVIAAAMIE